MKTIRISQFKGKTDSSFWKDQEDMIFNPKIELLRYPFKIQGNKGDQCGLYDVPI